MKLGRTGHTIRYSNVATCTESWLGALLDAGVISGRSSRVVGMNSLRLSFSFVSISFHRETKTSQWVFLSFIRLALNFNLCLLKSRLQLCLRISDVILFYFIFDSIEV